MKIDCIINGDLILKKPKFVLTDYQTWLGPFIVFFQNLYPGKKCPYSHNLSAVSDGGILYLYEAAAEYQRTPIKDYFQAHLFAGGSLDDFIVLRPNFPFNALKLRDTANSMLNELYGLKEVIEDQLPYQLSDERFWIGPRHFNNRPYCSEAEGYLKFRSCYESDFACSGGSVYSFFKNYFKLSPRDLFLCKFYNHYSLNL